MRSNSYSTSDSSSDGEGERAALETERRLEEVFCFFGLGDSVFSSSSSSSSPWCCLRALSSSSCRWIILNSSLVSVNASGIEFPVDRRIRPVERIGVEEVRDDEGELFDERTRLRPEAVEDFFPSSSPPSSSDWIIDTSFSSVSFCFFLFGVSFAFGVDFPCVGVWVWVWGWGGKCESKLIVGAKDSTGRRIRVGRDELQPTMQSSTVQYNIIQPIEWNQFNRQSTVNASHSHLISSHQWIHAVLSIACNIDQCPSATHCM